MSARTEFGLTPEQAAAKIICAYENPETVVKFGGNQFRRLYLSFIKI
ncbi:MAG: hypothetical protein PHY16_00660 [Methylobacter sp.]|nr:hypothetical protein [Methylobacter sp.]